MEEACRSHSRSEDTVTRGEAAAVYRGDGHKESAVVQPRERKPRVCSRREMM